jgi:hypothetical protein
MKQETIEEAAESVYNEFPLRSESLNELAKGNFIKGAKWQQERSQMIVPPDATNIEVFAIKPDENGKLFAYIGYKTSNGNFEFSTVPFTEPKPERMYSEAIEFAEWIRIKDFQTASKNNWIGLDMRYYTTEELFEQFKKK